MSLLINHVSSSKNEKMEKQFHTRQSEPTLPFTCISPFSTSFLRSSNSVVAFTKSAAAASTEGEANRLLAAPPSLLIYTRFTVHFTFAQSGAKTRFEPCRFTSAMLSENRQIQGEKRRFQEAALTAADHLRRSRKGHGCVSLCASTAAL